MDAIAFLVGILAIMGTLGGLGLRALYLHHVERMTQLRIEEYASQAKYSLMNKALDKNALPMGRFNLDN